MNQKTNLIKIQRGLAVPHLGIWRQPAEPTQHNTTPCHWVLITYTDLISRPFSTFAAFLEIIILTDGLSGLEQKLIVLKLLDTIWNFLGDGNSSFHLVLQAKGRCVEGKREQAQLGTGWCQLRKLTIYALYSFLKARLIIPRKVASVN